MQEEQDTCRICSAPAEPDQPLFHPCKCCGTIRYIHQDCLTTWLAHSKKQTCDVCKYPYSFTKVYASDMPTRLPPLLVARKLIQQFTFLVLFSIRAIIVACVWLALLPWVTVWTWRAYFAMGESTAFWIGDVSKPPMGSGYPIQQNNSTPHNVTTPPLNASLITMMSSHPAWKALSSDIFLGQIIASLIVLTFVAVFLLREWVSQNARPGLFEEMDGLAQVEDAPAQHQPAHPVDGERQPHGPEAHPPQNVFAAGPVLNGEPRRRFPEHRVIQRRHLGQRRRRTGQNLHEGDKKADREDEEPDVDGHVPVRRRLDVKQATESEDENYNIYSHRGRTLRDLQREAKRRATDKLPQPPLEIDPDDAKFTFTAKLPPRAIEPTDLSSNSPDLSKSTTLFSSSSYFWIPNGQTADDFETAAPPRSASSSSLFHDASGDVLESSESPLSFPSTSTFTRRRPFENEETNTAEILVSNSSPTEFNSEVPEFSRKTPNHSNPHQYPVAPRRPPMPSATVSPPEGVVLSSPGVSASSAGFKFDGGEPASPSLATYSAPEELESGSSKTTVEEYFDRKLPDEQDQELAAEHGRYFRNPADEDEDDGASENEGDATQELFSESEDEDGVMPALVRNDEGVEENNQVDPNARMRNGHANVQPGPPQGPDLNEELEGNLDDDMEGAMEAIGLRGPILTVVQNAALMVFVLDTSIGLGVWVPFTVGKSTALLTLNPRRLIQLVHFPIKAIRLVTDPVVDSLLIFLRTFLLAPALKSLERLALASVSSFLYIVSLAFGLETSGRLFQRLSDSYHLGSTLVARAHKQAGGLFASDKVAQAVETADPQPWAILADLTFDSSIGRMFEPYFSFIGRDVRINAEYFKDNWVRLTLGTGPVERVFAISLGYGMVAFGLAIYMNILTVGTVKNAGKAVRTAVRQQLLVVKVAAFIIIELFIFPLGCGIILDSCTIWFFPEANLRARLAFVRYAPLTATFYHWVIGTMFMYLFAILLGGCRWIMRPGAMWFIKDPQNQNMHPIRDILDRPTFTHLYKLFQSAIMYSLVVIVGVGNVACLIQLLSPPLLPFRWKPREPLSTVPYDLVFLHLVLPYTIHYFRPRKAAREIGIVLWKWLSVKLRLSSYMFGGRYPAEESQSRSSILSWLLWKTQPQGSWRRVPANDNVAIVRNMRATAEVDENGNPLNEKEKAAVEAQNDEAARNRRNADDDYIVVYIPPYFRYRIMLFIFAIWSACCLGTASMITLPTLLGRRFFLLFTSREVHDGYSFIVGFHLLWACYLIGRAMDRLDRRRQRKQGTRAWWPLFLTKRTLLWVAKATFMAFFIVVLIPTLIALVVELYIVLPLRSIYNPALEIRVRLVDMWVLGLFYSKIILRLPGFEAPREMNQGIQNINRNGWTRPDPIAAMKEVIAPAVAGLLGMILLPPAVLWICMKFTSLPIHGRTLFINIYPAIFAGAGIGRAIWSLHEVYGKWSQSVRDKEFLIEMRLRNLEGVEEKEKTKGIDADVGEERSDVESDEER